MPVMVWTSSMNTAVHAGRFAKFRGIQPTLTLAVRFLAIVHTRLVPRLRTHPTPTLLSGQTFKAPEAFNSAIATASQACHCTTSDTGALQHTKTACSRQLPLP